MSGLAKYHNELTELMLKHKGKTFCRKEIIDMFEETYPSLRSDFVQPSDHCIDHICKQACKNEFLGPGLDS